MLSPLITDPGLVRVIEVPSVAGTGSEGEHSGCLDHGAGTDGPSTQGCLTPPRRTRKGEEAGSQEKHVLGDDLTRIVGRAYEVRNILAQLQSHAEEATWHRVAEIVTEGLQDPKNWTQDPAEALPERYDGRCRWHGCKKAFGEPQTQKFDHERNCPSRPVWATPDLPKKKIPAGAMNNGRAGKASAEGQGVMAQDLSKPATAGLVAFRAAELGAGNGATTVLATQWTACTGIKPAPEDEFEFSR